MKTLTIHLSMAQAEALRRNGIRLCIVTQEGGETVIRGLLDVPESRVAQAAAVAMGWREAGPQRLSTGTKQKDQS